MMNSIYIDTLGCFKNIEDSERAAGLLRASGFDLAGAPEDADVIIVNTCGFIEDAKRESIDRVLELAAHKAHGAKLIVSGCLSQRYPDEIFVEIPEADAVIGVNEYERLPEIVAALLEGETPGDSTSARRTLRADCEAEPEYRTLRTDGEAEPGRRILRTDGAPGILTGPRVRTDAGATAYLKIAEGCDNRCAYCAIPMIRGPYRSVPMEALTGEAASLAASGVRELVLIAQDVSAYGADIYEKYALPKLLGELAGEAAKGAEEVRSEVGEAAKGAGKVRSEVGEVAKENGKSNTGVGEAAKGAGEPNPGIEWLRLMYCYEERVTDELIAAIAAHPSVCNYIDIPLQHISDAVLKRMGRRSTHASIEATIAKLRAAIPDIAIRTTFMTGFPGETEEDFDELMDFAMAQRFERLGVFAYSPEDGTRAADMPDQIPREIAEERRDALMRQQVGISLEKNKAFIGRTLKVLVEALDTDETQDTEVTGYTGRTNVDNSPDRTAYDALQENGNHTGEQTITYTGRTEYDAPEIDGAVIFTSTKPLPIGTFAEVLITDAMDYDLVGQAKKEPRFL
ncbi:MAG: MiaB/RimO family radical SAM methylthiotransferase [Clostridiales Family XIII bacterium]|nr:MiaB/RimO family radical SAM methylthiotransferase [Clostridiales Family XIII bacterium]